MPYDANKSPDNMTDEEFDAAFNEMTSLDVPNPEFNDSESEEPRAEASGSEDEGQESDDDKDLKDDIEDKVEEPEDADDADSNDDTSEDEDDNESDSEQDSGSEEENTDDSEDDTESTNEDATFDFASIPMDEIIPMEIAANGMKVKATMNELVEGFKKGMNYTQKMQALSSHRKELGILQDNGLSSEDLNLLIEAKSGNKDAIAKLLADAKVDPLEIEEGSKDYTPKEYGKETPDFEMEQVKDTILADKEYSPLVEEAISSMPDDMYDMVSSTPSNLDALYKDVKAGVYQEVMPEVIKIQSLYGKTKPTMNLYVEVAAKMAEQRAKADTGTNEDSTEQQKVKTQERNNKRKKAAVSSTPNKAKTVDVVKDINEMDDDEFNKAFEKITGRSANEDY